MEDKALAENIVRELEGEERGSPCFVRHPDAGGQCERPAEKLVYGLCFCAPHGEEAGAGALHGAYLDASYFFERLRNPHVPALSGLIDQELEGVANRLSRGASDDGAYHEALVRAYPDEAIPESVRRQIEDWACDERPGVGVVENLLLDSLATLHKILRTAYQDGQTWLVENLDEQRQAEAARASYAMRALISSAPQG